MLTLRAAVAPSSFDEEKRTVEVVWTTGAKGLRRSFWEDYYEELSLDADAVRLQRLNDGAPLLAAHEAYSLDGVIGVVERAWIANGEGRAVVRFSDRSDVQPIVKDIQSGILRAISVGYQVYRYEVTKDVDSDLDTYRAVDWEPMELSIVPIPFDAGAKVRGEEKRSTHPVTIIHRGDAADEDLAMPKETNPANEQTASNQQAVDAARAEGGEAGIKAERARAAEIRSSVRKAGLDDALAEKLITDGVSIDAARAAIIDAMATRQQEDQPRTWGQHVEAGDDQRDKWLRGAGEAILVRAGLVRLFGAEGSKMSGDGFRGMSLLELARDYLERSGVRTRNMDRMRLVGEAFMHRGGGYNGVSDFSVLLENTIHKVLLASFATTADTWRRFCHIGSVSDFRPHNRYQLGTFGTLDVLNEHGEFKNKQIPDGAKESIVAGTKGNIIALTRQAIINDDMGVFNGLATAFGRSAALSIEVDVYAALALNSGAGPVLNDGNPVFYNRSGANNITTSSALTADNLDLDRQAMASMKDISGNEYLDLRPAVLLVPLSLGSKGREINAMEFNEESNKQNKRPNSVRGLFRDIVDTPRLSGNRRYLFADPDIAPVLEVAFLDGQQTPFLDNQTGWRVDGVEWKVRLDYGVGGVGYQGAITNAGG